MRISDWSSDVCSSDLRGASVRRRPQLGDRIADDRGALRRQQVDQHPPLRAVGILHLAPVAIDRDHLDRQIGARSGEHTSEPQSLIPLSYAVLLFKQKITNKKYIT